LYVEAQGDRKQRAKTSVRDSDSRGVRQLFQLIYSRNQLDNSGRIRLVVEWPLLHAENVADQETMFHLMVAVSVGRIATGPRDAKSVTTLLTAEVLSSLGVIKMLASQGNLDIFIF
jgi:hypothetical protein